jgi:hypothetical protein
LRDRRICFAFSTRKQQILRCAQDDTREEQFFQQPVDEASAWNPPELWRMRRLGCGALFRLTSNCVAFTIKREMTLFHHHRHHHHHEMIVSAGMCG